MFNVFGGGWTEIDKSATGGGISNTGVAISPVVAVNKSGLFPAVAWMDRTPHIQAANNGNGDANKVEVYLRQFTRTDVMPAALAQFDAPDHQVPAGGRTSGGAITFGGVVTATEGADGARLEVEMQRVTPPGNMTVEATGPTGAVVTYQVPSLVSCTPASGSTFPLGATRVNCGPFSFTVTVTDTTPPMLNLPSSITVDATSPAGAVVRYEVSAVDLVDGTLPVDCLPASDATFAVGTGRVNCSASDSSRNRVTGGFSVTVRSAAEMLTTLIADANGNNLLASALRQIGTPPACNQRNAFQHQRQPTNLITLAVGGMKPIRVDIRLIAATNRDLEAAVAESRFRPDLLYRLKVITIKSPLLRDRCTDNPILARHFVKIHGKNVKGLSADAEAMPVNYDWPGNVRELQNVIERTVHLRCGK